MAFDIAKAAEAYLTYNEVGGVDESEVTARLDDPSWRAALLNAAKVVGRSCSPERIRPAFTGAPAEEIVAVIEAAGWPQLGLWAAESEGARLRPSLLDAAESHLSRPLFERRGLGLILALSVIGPLDEYLEPLLIPELSTRFAEEIHVGLLGLLRALPVHRREHLLLGHGRLPWHLLETCPTERVVSTALGAATELTSHHEEAQAAQGLIALGRSIQLKDRIFKALTASPSEQGIRALTTAASELAEIEDMSTLEALASQNDPMVQESARAAIHRLDRSSSTASSGIEEDSLRRAVESCYRLVQKEERPWEKAIDELIEHLGHDEEEIAVALGEAFVRRQWPHVPKPYGYFTAFHQLLARLGVRQGQRRASTLLAEVLLSLGPDRSIAAHLPSVHIPGFELVAEVLAERLDHEHGLRWFDWLVARAPGVTGVKEALRRGLASRDDRVRQVCRHGLRMSGVASGDVWDFEVSSNGVPLERFRQLSEALVAREGYGGFQIFLRDHRGGQDIALFYDDIDGGVQALTSFLALCPEAEPFERFDGMLRALAPLQYQSLNSPSVYPTDGGDLTPLDAKTARARVAQMIDNDIVSGEVVSRELALGQALVDSLLALDLDLFETTRPLLGFAYEAGFFFSDDDGSLCGMIWYGNDQ